VRCDRIDRAAYLIRRKLLSRKLVSQAIYQSFDFAGSFLKSSTGAFAIAAHH